MRNIILALILTVITHQLLSQSLCFEQADGSYWPIEIGLNLKYSSGRDSYISSFKGDSIKLEGQYYLIETKVYASGNTKTSYWREKNDTVYSYNEEKGFETMELPGSPRVGQTWSSPDKEWTYRIISLNSRYSTPYCQFSNLLEVKTNSSERIGTDYNLFYKKGVGMVGLSINSNPYTYIKPNKKLNERNFMAYGCENSGTEQEIQKCTYDKISDHIRDNFKPPFKVKKGKLLLKVLIGKDGTVEEVTVLEGLKKADKQTNEAIRVIKSLPKFIPAQIDDNQPMKASFNVPFNF